MNLWGMITRSEPSPIEVRNAQPEVRGDRWLGLSPWFNQAPAQSKYEVNLTDLESVAREVLMSSPPIWSLIDLRRRLFSQGRFQFQRLVNGRPGDYFGTQELACLEVPWAGGTTASLLSRILLSVDLAGNAYILRRGDTLRVLRPDWVTSIYGSNLDADFPGDAPDAVLLGYVYTPRRRGSYSDYQADAAPDDQAYYLSPEEVAHYAPMPDPLAYRRGMSWLTPLIREIGADIDMTIHKGGFFRDGASPRLMLKYDSSISPQNFLKMKELFENNHGGPWNAYSTLHLGGGVEPHVAGFNLKDLDFSKVQNSSEARLAAAAGIPAAVVGFEVGLQGSSLNAGNLQQLKRLTGEALLIPLWDEVAAALEPLLTMPDGGRAAGRTQLAIDRRDVAFLRDDATASADIYVAKVGAIGSLIQQGFTPNSAITSAQTEDFAALVDQHTGLFSVQLQPPNASGADANTANAAQAALDAGPAAPDTPALPPGSGDPADSKPAGQEAAA